jgi:hypothetical protein
MTSIKRVSYVYNSVLEDQGQDCYFLDVMDFEDGESLVDVHKAYRSKREFLDEIEKLLPLVGGTSEENDTSGTFV